MERTLRTFREKLIYEAAMNWSNVINEKINIFLNWEL